MNPLELSGPPTSQEANRSRDPQKIVRDAGEDFFNTIGQQRTYARQQTALLDYFVRGALNLGRPTCVGNLLDHLVCSR